jgi:hypothetical protein
MEPVIRAHLEDVRSGDKDRQNTAFSQLMAATETPVSWAYEAWDELVSLLAHPNNRTRAIAAQVLCNLAKSDPDVRMVEDLDALLAVTKDERFVTARHCLQSLWKVGSAGPRQRERLLNGLETRFHECSEEKNCTLIRFDIIQSLRFVWEESGDEAVATTAAALIELEEDPRYRKKYARLWPARGGPVTDRGRTR